MIFWKTLLINGAVPGLLPGSFLKLWLSVPGSLTGFLKRRLPVQGLMPGGFLLRAWFLPSLLPRNPCGSPLRDCYPATSCSALITRHFFARVLSTPDFLLRNLWRISDPAAYRAFHRIRCKIMFLKNKRQCRSEPAVFAIFFLCLYFYGQ
jgi:hypothetical protein